MDRHRRMTLSSVAFLQMLACGVERPPVERGALEGSTQSDLPPAASMLTPPADSGEAPSASPATAHQSGSMTWEQGATSVVSSNGGATDANSPTDDREGDTPAPNPDTGSTHEGVSSAASEQDPNTRSPGASGTPTEEFVTAVPIARGEHGVGTLAGEVYILGGFTPAVTSSVQAYSPDTEQWRDVADFPVVFHHPNVATVDNKLYVVGFHAGSGQRKGDPGSYVYDPDVNQWQAVAPMPPETARGASCVTTYAGKVYVFGGTNDVALPDASVYDPALDEWETLPFLPATRHHCVAATVGEQIYIVSGRDVIIEEVQAESYVFDPETRQYTEVAPILTPRGGAAGALLGGKIYVFGGEGNSADPRKIFHETEVYDPASDSWTALPDMSVPRHGFGAAVIGDRIYLPAGSISQGIDVVDTHTVFYFE